MTTSIVPTESSERANVDELCKHLDHARAILSSATTDLERLQQVRTASHAVRAAAEILKRKDIEVQASILMATAERAIAKSTPPTPPESRSPGRHGAPDTDDTGETDISPAVVRTIRYTHSGVSDEAFSGAVDQATVTQRPITRATIKGLKPRDPDEENKPRATDTSDTPLAKAQEDIRALRQMLKDSEKKVRAESVGKQQAQDELRVVMNQLPKNQAEAVKREKAHLTQVRTLKSQIAEWQTKCADLQRQVAGLKKAAKAKKT